MPLKIFWMQRLAQIYIVCFYFLIGIADCYAADNLLSISLSPSVGSFNSKDFFSSDAEIKIKKKLQKAQYDYGIQGSIVSQLFYNNKDVSRLYAKANVFFKSQYGTLRLGPDVGGHYLLQADDFKNQSFSQSASFIEMYLKQTLHSDFASPDLYIYSPGLWSDQLHLQNQMIDGSKVANKITYISPMHHDLVFAISFIPDAQEFIKSYNTTHVKRDNDFKNIIQLTAAYRKHWDNFDFKIAVGFESGQAKNFAEQLFLPTENLLLLPQNQKNLKSWDISSEAAYMGVKFGISYGNIYKSGQYQSDIKNGTYLNLGASYSIAGFTVSLSHFNSRNHYGDLERNALLLSYHIKKPVFIFTELSQIQLTNKALVRNFDCFLIGTKLIF